MAKCKLEEDLGQNIVGNSRTPAQTKSHETLGSPTSRSETKVRNLLRMSKYYSHYIENYATLVEPLTRVLKCKKGKKNIKWTGEMEEALQKGKYKLMQKLALFAPDFKKKFTMQTKYSI